MQALNKDWDESSKTIISDIASCPESTLRKYWPRAMRFLDWLTEKQEAEDPQVQYSMIIPHTVTIGLSTSNQGSCHFDRPPCLLADADNLSALSTSYFSFLAPVSNTSVLLHK